MTVTRLIQEILYYKYVVHVCVHFHNYQCFLEFLNSYFLINYLIRALFRISIKVRLSSDSSKSLASLSFFSASYFNARSLCSAANRSFSN